MDFWIDVMGRFPQFALAVLMWEAINVAMPYLVNLARLVFKSASRAAGSNRMRQ